MLKFTWLTLRYLGTACSTHRSGDREETVIADEHNAEDRCRAEQIVCDQPQLAQPSTQRPPACQDVGDINRDTERPYTKLMKNRTKT